jgi:hypothetical protein
MLKGDTIVIFTNESEKFFKDNWTPRVKLHTGLNTFPEGGINMRLYTLNELRLMKDNPYSNKELLPNITPYTFSVWIRIVSISDDDKLRTCPDGSIYVRNITVGERYSIFDIETVKLFNLPIGNSYIYSLCDHGRLDTLKKLIENNYEIPYNARTILFPACYRGHLNILQWWLNESGLPYHIYFDEMMEYGFKCASDGNHIEILNCLLDFLNNRDQYNNIFIYQCIRNPKYKYFEFFQDRLKNASIGGSVEILNFWKNINEVYHCGADRDSVKKCKHFLPTHFIYTEAVLDWWFNEGLAPEDLYFSYWDIPNVNTYSGKWKSYSGYFLKK